MKEVVLVVGASTSKLKPSWIKERYRHDEWVTSLSEALADVYKQVLLALADAPLGVEQLTFQFQFREMIPRGVLAAAWIDAVHRLAEVVSILPETTEPPTRIHRVVQESTLPTM